MGTRDWRSVVADVERAATTAGRDAGGLFSLEGTRLHERALRAGVRVHDVLTGAEETPPRLQELFTALERSGTQVHRAPREVMDRLTEGRSLGDVIGVAAIPPSRPLEELLAGDTPVLLVGVEVQDPGNVGALVRTARAAGAAAYVAAGRGDPYHPRAVRTSMGGLFKLPVLRLPSGEEALALLRRHGAHTVAAVSRGGVPPAACRFPDRPVALLVGSEAFGLPAGLRDVVDGRVTIPMAGGIDSYSVNAAAAVLLYELTVRRRA
ncbi:MAG: RNA methyltransferase [Acidobacteriota bacterium]|jgi:TrmH family RNA methyltransferase